MASTAPTPRRRPVRYGLAAVLTMGVAGCVSSPAPYRRPAQPSIAAQFAPAQSDRQCLAKLGLTQANFTPLPDKVFGTGCATLGTVRLSWLRSDDAHLQLANLGPVTCSLATALEGWARFGVDHAARQTLGSPLARIDTFGSYSCRNIAGTDHRSGHATANAVDIAAFVLADGRRISVKADWSDGTPEVRNFLRLIRTSACRRFAMVLTPDYNTAHHDHFHLEVGTQHPICH